MQLTLPAALEMEVLHSLGIQQQKLVLECLVA